HTPVWSLGAAIELVVPLAITVLVVQNGQGIAVLRAVGHQPPVNAITAACGIGSLIAAVFGGVSTCLTGPTNAIVSSSGEKSRHYTGGIFVGLLALAFGLLAPTFTRFLLDAPEAFVMTLAGLALLKILQAAFTTCFSDRCTLGALIAFLVTVADLPLFSIGAAFWGLVAGILISRLLERDDFRATEDGV
ncbi:MAG: benzoate/H(+) symporter BenE family transporter, partial [Gammaproteobacteria bacterium]